jgi:deazaflavin-dependent oxidoreductase (nitroreductase family)
MLGRTFLMLVHVGRRTGEPHETVAMVLADDEDTGEVVIVSAWGADADWLRNLRAGPAREVRIGHDRFEPEHRFLDEDEGVAVGIAFRHRHRKRVWLLSTILGWGDMRNDQVVREFVQGHPLVGLRPTNAESLPADRSPGWRRQRASEVASNRQRERGALSVRCESVDVL